MARISPELEVWLVADPEMCGSWRRLARAVQLQSCVPRLEVTTRRRLRTDSDKLGEVLRLWRQCHPHTYTVHTLLAVLDTMGMKSMYEWVELMTKERLDVEAVETYVTRCNTPHLSRAATPRSHALSPAHRAARASPGHSLSPTPSLSRPLSVISEDLASSLSHSSATVSSSASPPLRGAGGVFSTLYRPRPGGVAAARPSSASQLRRLSQQRHSCHLATAAPAITLDTGTPSPDCVPRPRSVLDQFDEALAEYRQMDKRATRNRSSIHSDRYFDNLAALLREL